MRTGGSCRTVDREISRFPRKERLHMPGSSTTPGRQALAMVRLFVLPSALETASAPGSRLSRLNGWPMPSPTDASSPSSRTPTHGSAIAVIEPTKDYFLPVATLAGEFEKELVELADSHDDSPTIRECQKAIYRQFQIARSGPKFE